MSPGRHGRSAPSAVVVDGPPVGERGRHRGGDVGRLAEPQGVGGAQLAVAAVRSEVIVTIGSEYGHRAVTEGDCRPTRIQRLERWLGIGLECDEPAEDVVGEVDHGLRRSEIGRERDAVGADLVAGAQVLGDVGAAETVDGLLGIADDEQPAGERAEPSPCRSAGAIGRGLVGIVGIGGETDGDLELDRVGVLELVEEHPLVPLVEEPTEVGPIGQQAPGENEQIVELEQTGLGASRGGIEDESAHHRAEKDSTVASDRFEKFPRDPSEFDLEALQRFEIGRAVGPERFRPLALRSRPALAVTPVPEPAIEFDDQLEPGSHAVGRREIVDEGGDVAGRLGLRVVGRYRCGTDRSAGREERGDVETQRPRVGQVDAVDDQVPIGPEVVGHAASTLVDAEAVELAEFDEGAPAVDHAAGRIGFVEQAVEEIVPLLLEASPLSSSSSTENPGGRPASIGKSNSIRRANECRVPIGA